MSNDLISRSAVMDYLREQHAKIIIEKNKNKYGIVTEDVLKGMQAAADAFINFIVQVPTSYDVDKVVEQLEDKALEHAINGQQYGEDGYDTHENTENAIKQGIEESIEIVKAGGKGDNN